MAFTFISQISNHKCLLQMCDSLNCINSPNRDSFCSAALYADNSFYYSHRESYVFTYQSSVQFQVLPVPNLILIDMDCVSVLTLGCFREELYKMLLCTQILLLL